MNDPKIEYILNWNGFSEFKSKCFIRIYEGKGEASGKTVIIATDMKKGTSVTSGCEIIATIVCHDNNIDPSRLLFIEHYKAEKGKRSLFPKETFDRVTFSFNSAENKFEHPVWSDLDSSEVNKIIDCL